MSAGLLREVGAGEQVGGEGKATGTGGKLAVEGLHVAVTYVSGRGD